MRRALKITGWALGGLLLLIVLVLVAVYIGGNTDSGRAMIERTTDRLTGGHVKLTGLAGAFPRELTLDKLQLSDDRGVWLTAERIVLRWTPRAILLHRLQIDSLLAARVNMERLPESSPNAPSSTPSIPHIDAARVSIGVLELGPQLAGTAASLVVQGGVHLRSLSDMVIDLDAKRIGGDGTYVVHLQFDPKRMDAALKLNEPAGGPLENMLQLPGLGALAATVNLTGPRSAEKLELSIDAGGLHGSAHGNVNVNELSGDLNFAFQTQAMSVRPELAWERAVLQGRSQGNFKAPTADGHLEVQNLQLPGGTQMATLKADLTASGGTAALKALIGGLRIPGAQPRLLQDSPLTVDALIHLNEPARPVDVTASHRLFSLSARAETTAAKAGKRSATLELRLPNLTPLAALGGQKARGTASIKAQLQSDDAAIRLGLDASAALIQGTEIWSSALGTRATLQLSGALTDKTVTLDSLKFSGRALSLTAGGSASRPAAAGRNPGPWSIRLPWTLSVSDLAALSPSLAGTMKASGTVEGPLTSLTATAKLTSMLSLDGTPSGAVSAEAVLHGLPSALSGTVAAHGTLDASPLDVEVDIERSQAGSMHALLRRADWKSAHANGDVTMPVNFAQTHGRLQLKVAALKDFRDILGDNIAGSVAGTVDLHPDKGRTRAQLQFEAQDLTVGQFAGTVSATGDGFADALQLKLDVKVPDVGGAAASLSATGVLNANAREISLATAVANYHGQDVRLLSPARVSFANGVAVDVLKVGAQEAVFQLKGRISPTLSLRASLRKVEPSLVNVFFPGLLGAGTIEARAQLDGTMAAPTGRVQLNATGMRWADDAALGLPAFDLHATAQLKGDTADVDAGLSAGSAQQVKVTGHAPLAAGGAFDLKVNGNLDVGLLNPLVEAAGQHVAGRVSMDATVTGRLAQPEIEGTVNLKDGSFADYGRGISVTDINGEIVGGEGKLQIKSLTASAAPGSLSVTGTVGILQSGLPVDLKITAKNAQPIASKLITSNFDADLHVIGTARERLDIAGSVHLNRTVIGITRTLPPNVAVLDVRRRGKTAAAPRAKRLVIGLDVALNAPREILVQGRGLDAEVGGELHIKGTLDAPIVTGGFDLERGSVSVGSAKLNFNSGRVISFEGAGLQNKIDPTLDFTAQTTSADATVTVRITGHADAPQFEFSSNPALPADEILARLLFGESVASLSPLQLAQIGATVATLSGVGGDGSLNPLVKLQKTLGLDRLSVGAAQGTNANGTENTGASIEAGRYVSSRVYVEARQSSNGTSQLETDIDITKKLKLTTRLGNGTASAQGTTPENDPGSSIGLSYQFEY